jgi:hypothetical protein
LSDKDEIKELFQKELGNYEVKVDPSLWQGIQSGISAGATSATSAIGVGAKVAIGVVATTLITVAAIIVYNVSTEEISEENKKTQQISKIEPTSEENVSVNDQLAKDLNRKKPIESETTFETDKTKLKVENVENKVDNSIEYKPLDEVKKEGEDQLQDIVVEKQIIEPIIGEAVSNTEIVDESSSSEEDDIILELFLDPAVIKQDNQYVVFDIKDSNVDNVVWNFGDGEFSRELRTEHFYQKQGEYNVIVKGFKGKLEISKTITVVVSVEGEFTNLPNGITPNGDNVNDFLFVESKGIKEFQINVMNSKQEVIFQSSDVNFRWDGNLSSGLPAKTGRYIYVIIAKDDQGNIINKYQQLEIKR